MTDQEWQAFLGRQKRRRDDYHRQVRHLIATIRQGRAEGETVYGFYATNSKMVAVVQDFGTHFRITRFADIGAMGHSEVKSLDKLPGELRESGFRPIADANALQVVERWSDTETWARGLDSMRLIAIAQTLYDAGEYDKSREIHRTCDLKQGLAWVRELGLSIY